MAALATVVTILLFLTSSRCRTGREQCRGMGLMPCRDALPHVRSAQVRVGEAHACGTDIIVTHSILCLCSFCDEGTCNFLHISTKHLREPQPCLGANTDEEKREHELMCSVLIHDVLHFKFSAPFVQYACVRSRSCTQPATRSGARCPS